MNAVPFFRPSIGTSEIKAVTDAITSGWLTTGPNVAKFEREFANRIGGDVHAVAVNSATSALHLALEAMGITEGDEVIAPTLTFTATAEVARYLGAKVVLVDVDPDTLCISPDAVQAAITPKTRAIIPVHFAGYPADLTRLRNIANQHGLLLLDDAAHALPTQHRGQMIGNCFADATAFSFYATKTMTTGEGGMLVTRNPQIAARARKMRLHGIDRDVYDRFSNTNASWRYDIVAPGYKYNMTDFSAAMGRVQLRKLDKFKDQRATLVDRYRTALADLPLILPQDAKGNDAHSWHLFAVQVREDAAITRDQLFEYLQTARIGSSVHYRPLHRMSYWAPNGLNADFVNANLYYKRCLSLPLFMCMTHAEQDQVIKAVRGAFKQ